MIVSDVALRVRRTFGDEASVQITDADIIRWINDSQRHITLRNEGLMEAKAVSDIVVGQVDYDTPADMSVLRSLSYQGSKLTNLSFNDFNEYIYGNAPNSNQGCPLYYMVWNDKISIYPPSSVAATGGLYIYYIKHPADVVTMADALSLPLEYHNAIVDYCLQQAFELDEDPQKSVLKENQFEKKVMELNDRNKWTAQEYYPSVTVLPEDAW
jgi:hypothetical protein